MSGGMTVRPKRRRKRHKPGEICRVSGQYTLTNGKQATVVKGEPFPPVPRPRMTEAAMRFPPTPRPRMGWLLTDRSR